MVVYKLAGTVVGLLNIRMVGEAKKTGTLELLQKPEVKRKPLLPLMNSSLLHYAGGHITIVTRNNENLSSNSLNWFVVYLARQASKSFPISDLL